MKPDERLKSALQSIARREVPETVNLWPQLASALEQKEIKTMKPARKLLWTVLLVLLALALVSGVAYALYNYFRGDVGLEAVSQAGLVSEQNATAVPTPLPTATPLPPAVPVGEAQTLQGVTLRLDWVYLDHMWQAIGFSVSGLKDGKHLGIPQLNFGNLQAEQYVGAGMALTPGESGWKGRYVVHQLIRASETPGRTETLTDLSLAIPLLDENGMVLDTFRFTAAQVLVHQTSYGGGNTYAVRYGGQETRLEWVVATPQETRARLCYQQSSIPSPKLSYAAGLESGQNPQTIFTAPAVLPQRLIESVAENGWHCLEALFPPLPQDVQSLRVLVEGLQDATGQHLGGSLEFIWAELPWRKSVPGIDPLPSQELGEIRVTLLHAYVDALRAAVVYRVEGLSAAQYPDIQLTDLEGKPFFVGGGGVQSAENDPTVFIATLTFAQPPGQKADSDVFSSRQPIVNGRFVGKLKITFNVWQAQGGQEFTFDLDLPAYPAVVLTPLQDVSAEGLQMRLEKLEITPSFTRAYLCYHKPGQADWMLSNQTTLQIGQAQASLSDYRLIFDSDYGMTGRPEWATLPGNVRCVIGGFAVGHHSRPEALILTVRIEQSQPEIIPDDQLQAAREKLRQQGIEIEWITFSGNGGGGAWPQIKQKPPQMTDLEVLQRFYDALGYSFPAPWTFSVEFQP